MKHDKQLWAAFLAALLFWAALFAIVRPKVDLLWPLQSFAVFLLLALVYPVLEEIVFRGALQGYLHTKFNQKTRGPISLANLLTSLTFASLHFFFHTPLWATLVIVPSLVLGYFRDKYGNLVAPIVLHVFYNSGYYWIFEAQ